MPARYDTGSVGKITRYYYVDKLFASKRFHGVFSGILKLLRGQSNDTYASYRSNAAMGKLLIKSSYSPKINDIVPTRQVGMAAMKFCQCEPKLSK